MENSLMHLKMIPRVKKQREQINNYLESKVHAKGQLISKGVLMSSISSKKRTKEFDFTIMIPQIDLFSFVFWRKFEEFLRTFSAGHLAVSLTRGDCV